MSPLTTFVASAYHPLLTRQGLSGISNPLQSGSSFWNLIGTGSKEPHEGEKYNERSSLYTHKRLSRPPIGACRARNRSFRRTNGQRVRVGCGRPALRERLLIRNWPGGCSGTLHLWHLAGLPRHRVAGGESSSLHKAVHRRSLM